MGVKTIIVCDGCGQELKERRERYHLNLKTDTFLDGAGDTDYNSIDLEFCEDCANNIKNTLSKIVKDEG